MSNMQDEWETYTIRVKKDPAYPMHGTEIEFNGCRYIRSDTEKKKWKDCPVCAGQDLGCTYGLTEEERKAEKDSWK